MLYINEARNTKKKGIEAYQNLPFSSLGFDYVQICYILFPSVKVKMYTYQEVPEGTKESAGGPWQFIGLMPLFDPPRHDSAETICRALNLGVNVKMITGDQLAIGKETGRRLGMGTNMYPSYALLGQNKDESIAALPIDDLIEKADGFAGVFPELKIREINMTTFAKPENALKRAEGKLHSLHSLGP